MANMAPGFERLEKLFGASRRRDREKEKAKHQKKTPSVSPGSPSRAVPRSMFPSPSYLRPTSMHMLPRDALVSPRTRDDMGRSQSLSALHEELNRKSSVASSITAVDHDHQPTNVTPPTTSGGKVRNDAPRLSRFRFPEDSLFKNDELLRTSGDECLGGALPEQSSHTQENSLHTEHKLLDWSPKHISMLFSPADFEATLSSRQPTSRKGSDDSSVLLPSPIFADSLASPNRHEPLDPPLSPTSSPLRRSWSKSKQQLELFPHPQLLATSVKPNIDSPPPSDSETDSTTSSKDRYMQSAASPSRSTDTTPRPPVALFQRSLSQGRRIQRSIRETWGSGYQDPQVSNSRPRTSASVPRSRLLHKSASIATLSELATQIARDSILREPTFDDFYALEDDDIAESRPSTPEPDATQPPPPPPKDITPGRSIAIGATRGLSCQPTVMTLALDSHGQITPPCTPTGSNFKSGVHSPPSPSRAQGAVWAVELAKKYNFDVVYIIKFWASEARDSSSSAQHLLPNERQLVNDDGDHKRQDPSQSPCMTGRVLAAYGLTELPTPFQIISQVHDNALHCDTWREYRDPGAPPDGIARGWTHSFRPRPPGIQDGTKNQGYVFAAYAKQANNSALATRTIDEKELLLGALYFDAKTLVDALISSDIQTEGEP
ncbi:hypothetical protein F4778DRAFT_106798 [Xylariomycetidae sp. FL2044]|nr:hypothetical protein F4778DRAFT_106798 [Xylariomycetidae sp. FL2044]